ncbi:MULTISPECIES: hypothetical protein [Gordonia]|uniref:hypothetical protein n=1 Tax=Gordonia TaxID=2053 RepID=UPI00301AB32A
MVVRAGAGVTALIVLSALVVSCSQETPPEPSTAAAPSSVGSSRAASVPTAERSELEKIAAVQVCRNVITSAGAMVRDYNVFITKLNSVQSYAKMSSEDRWAADTLTAGADQVRKAIAPATPSDLLGPVNRFVDSSDDLAERIGEKQLGGLNAASDTWGADRTAALNKCSEFLPAE